ncbi:unnamed protein product [Clonostachys chloroleuca]|uniref:Uncharacterized protein n=1 Tax=Clonostachys chloroleuca TaxID=1926264 RepID=A0AA35M9T9_9HYPO|nr:unnamed protein product [Clonostachys chloroleuca]
MVKVLPPPKPDIPEPPPGMALSIAPAGHCLWLDDYEYYDQLGRDPLQQARIWLITDPEERVSKLKEVLENYPKSVHRRNMLYEAALRGDEALVRCLVSTGLKVHPDIAPLSEEDERADEEGKQNGEIPDRDDPSVVPVHAAAARGHVGCLKIFLEEGQVDVDIRDSIGRTPLIIGVHEPSVVQYLLEQGADPTAKTNVNDDLPKDEEDEYAGADALEFGAVHGNVDNLRLLLEHPFHGSQRNRKSRAGEEPGVWVTPLSIKGAASARNGFEALSFLLERGGYPTEAQNGHTKSELLTETERQAIVNATPGAAMDGPLESLKLLLSYQYPTNLDGDILPFDLPEELHKPFVYGAYDAMVYNRLDKFEFINGFDITEHETMSLDQLPAGQKLNIQHLLDKAVGGGSIECACFTIEKYGADPNKHRNPPGVKPLYAAAGNNKHEMVRLLVESYGADIHLGSGRYATGPTALWNAIMLKTFECVEYLLLQGGPVDHVDEEIRSISGPMTVILRADSSADKVSVKLETKENAKEFLAHHKGDWQNLNPPFVQLQLGPDDKGWIDSLQARRSDNELRESGDNAREFNREERVSKNDLGERDPRRLMVWLPTVGDRQSELKKDDDLLPEFRPFLVSAREVDSD